MTFLSPASRAVAGIGVLAVLFVVGGVATAAFAVSTTWSPPVNVSTTGQNLHPRIAVDASGLATAVWDNDDGSTSIVQASSSLNGGAWSSPTTVSTTGSNNLPQISVNGSGLATAVWQHFESNDHTVQASYSVSGEKWSTPFTVSTTGSNDLPQVTVDGSGLATAVWVSRDANNNNTVQVSSSANGGTWSNPTPLAFTGGTVPYPQIIVDGSGLATVVWQDSAGTLHSSSSLNGGTWSNPASVSSNEVSYDAKITVDGSGRVTAIWTHLDASVKLIVGSSYLHSDGTWSVPVDLSAAGQNARTPQITADGSGLATAVWTYPDTANNLIVQASTSLNGGGWSSPVPVSTAGQDTANPQITVDGSGLATAIWEGFNGNNTVAQASTSLNGATWSSPVVVSTLGQDANDPQIAADKSGFATAAWLRPDGESANTVQASFFDSRAPAAPVLAATGIDITTLAPTTIFALLAIIAGISMIHLRRRTQAPAALVSSTPQQHHTRSHKKPVAP